MGNACFIKFKILDFSGLIERLIFTSLYLFLLIALIYAYCSLSSLLKKYHNYRYMQNIDIMNVIKIIKLFWGRFLAWLSSHCLLIKVLMFLLLLMFKKATPCGYLRDVLVWAPAYFSMTIFGHHLFYLFGWGYLVPSYSLIIISFFDWSILWIFIQTHLLRILIAILLAPSFFFIWFFFKWCLKLWFNVVFLYLINSNTQIVATWFLIYQFFSGRIVLFYCAFPFFICNLLALKTCHSKLFCTLLIYLHCQSKKQEGPSKKHLRS